MDFEKENIITNRKIELGTFVQKKGEKIVDSKGSFYYEFDLIRNASNVPLKSFTWHEQLPTP